MKVVLCKAFGAAETLVREEVASPLPAKNEIPLQVHTAGVNFPDTLIIEGKYQFKPPLPFSPGAEAAGVVTAIGEKISHLKVGDLFDQAVRAIAWNGRLLVSGVASGRIPELPINLTLLKGAAVVGVFWGSFAQRQPQDNAANFQQLFSWLAEGELRPLVSRTYPLAEAAQAINDLDQRKAVGKVVVQVR